MKRLLLAVCALGLLSWPAVAEEKSPEQRREESNQIMNREGLQKFDFTRFVASGKNQRIGFFYSVHPDCTAQGDVEIRVTKQPEHGTTEFTGATLYPSFEKENIRYKCNQHKVRGQQLNYKSAEKYTGSDTLELLVLYPADSPGNIIST
jgi:Tfp pilus assembly protein PilV